MTPSSPGSLAPSLPSRSSPGSSRAPQRHPPADDFAAYEQKTKTDGKHGRLDGAARDDAHLWPVVYVVVFFHTPVLGYRSGETLPIKLEESAYFRRYQVAQTPVWCVSAEYAKGTEYEAWSKDAAPHAGFPRKRQQHVDSLSALRIQAGCVRVLCMLTSVMPILLANPSCKPGGFPFLVPSCMN